MGSLLADRNRLPGNDPGVHQPVRGGALQTFFKAQPSQCIDLCECFNRLLISRRSLMGDITPKPTSKIQILLCKLCTVASLVKECSHMYENLFFLNMLMKCSFISVNWEIFDLYGLHLHLIYENEGKISI